VQKDQPNPPKINAVVLLAVIAAVLLALFSFVAVKLAG
jgi:hypothetical protein